MRQRRRRTRGRMCKFARKRSEELGGCRTEDKRRKVEQRRRETRKMRRTRGNEECFALEKRATFVPLPLLGPSPVRPSPPALVSGSRPGDRSASISEKCRWIHLYSARRISRDYLRIAGLDERDFHSPKIYLDSLPSTYSYKRSRIEGIFAFSPIQPPAEFEFRPRVGSKVSTRLIITN